MNELQSIQRCRGFDNGPEITPFSLIENETKLKYQNCITFAWLKLRILLLLKCGAKFIK